MPRSASATRRSCWPRTSSSAACRRRAGGLGGRTSLHVYLYVPDVDALFAQAVAAGARDVMPVTNQPYGERSGGVVDPFGHV